MALPRLPPALASRGGLAAEVRVAGAEGTKDSSKNRERVAAKLGKPGLEVVVTDSPTFGLLGTFSYAGKVVAFSKKEGWGQGGEKG